MYYIYFFEVPVDDIHRRQNIFLDLQLMILINLDVRKFTVIILIHFSTSFNNTESDVVSQLNQMLIHE